MTFSWKKRGKIFSPHDHFKFSEFGGYAQSPQLIVLNDRVRIFFSIRFFEETSGKFLSHISYADYKKDLSQLLEVSSSEVIPLGKLGCFDEHGIFPFSPFQDRGELSAYTCGWSRRISVSVETATGLAYSEDNGKSFKKFGEGPVFANDLYEPFLVGDSFVRYFDGQYHMWYMFGQKWVKESEKSAPDRIYKIGHAKSSDGINWIRDHKAIIVDRLHENECQALPSVTYYNGKYHMVFCYRDVFGFRTDPNKFYRIGYAVSDDAENWSRSDDVLNLAIGAEGEFDSSMMCYPHLHAVNGRLIILYNGNEFGKFGFGLAINESAEFSYTQNESQVWDIENHFRKCPQNFISALKSRCDMGAYIQKLVKKSNRYEVWDKGQLIGLMAVYFNQEQASFIYVSNISLMEGYEGKGIAQHLVSQVIAKGKAMGFSSIQLEVSQKNERAISFYKKTGFLEKENCGEMLTYWLDLCRQTKSH